MHEFFDGQILTGHESQPWNWLNRLATLVHGARSVCHKRAVTGVANGGRLMLGDSRSISHARPARRKEDMPRD